MTVAVLSEISAISILQLIMPFACPSISALFVSIQKPYPTHCHGYGTEIFLYLSFKNVGPHLIQHMAELIICFRKEYGFIEADGIFKGDEFYRLLLKTIYTVYCNPLTCSQSRS
jgi:hypothetical protein